MLPQAFAHSSQKDVLPPVLSCVLVSSLIVSSTFSLPLRLSGESADDSGVVPHEESRAFDIDEAGDPVIDVDDSWRMFGTWDCPLVLLMLFFFKAPFVDGALLFGYDR